VSDPSWGHAQRSLPLIFRYIDANIAHREYLHGLCQGFRSPVHFLKDFTTFAAAQVAGAYPRGLVTTGALVVVARLRQSGRIELVPDFEAPLHRAVGEVSAVFLRRRCHWLLLLFPRHTFSPHRSVTTARLSSDTPERVRRRCDPE
jgi:hypothetical protein